MTRRPARAAPKPRAPSADARARILDAALAEIVARGFEAASTNAIARAAGVAKGLVFHHFGSKADLYLAVLDHVLLRVAVQVIEAPEPPMDLFAWLRDVAIRKLVVLQRDPLAYQFVLAARDAPPALRGEVERRMSAMRDEAWHRVRDALDTSRLRPGVTFEQAIETMSILGDGLDRRYLPRMAALPDRGMSQLEAIIEEVWGHYERLRDGIYAPAAGAAAPAAPRQEPRPRPKSPPRPKRPSRKAPRPRRGER